MSRFCSGAGRDRRKPGFSLALANGETDTCEKGFTKRVYTSMLNWANQEHKKAPAKPKSPAEDASLSLSQAIPRHKSPQAKSKAQP
jgi:hypothetical protein